EAPAVAATTASGLDPALYTPMKPTPGIGMPVDGGIDFQEQFSETGQTAHWINNAILVPMMVGVSLFVLILLFWVVFRFRRGANPVPSKTTHNTFIEIIWTVIPVLILVVIAVPSISLLAEQFEPAPEDALTVKVTGYQWYWGYSYPDNGDFEVISNMLTEEEAEARGEPYQLAADNRMVIPVGKPVKLLITAADVIHSFAIPAAWFKLDAVPGRINEKVLQIDREGVYYGQCSELCGARHGFMPITVEVLSEEKFNNWLLANGGTVKSDAAEPEATEVAAVTDTTTELAPADAAAATN
ncbi:MAG: cytochrome c oxidase subunit II, partial [Parasphingorhabdus sp.]